MRLPRRVFVSIVCKICGKVVAMEDKRIWKEVTVPCGGSQIEYQRGQAKLIRCLCGNDIQPMGGNGK